MAMDTVIFDVDGTLLDSNYHFALAWARAFAHHDLDIPVWLIHRHIGMGGDRLVSAVAGQDVEDQRGDDVRDRWEQEYDELIGETRLLPGARELLATLDQHGFKVALASSSKPQHADHALTLLRSEEQIDAATTAEDAEASKPDPQLIDEALSRVAAGAACVVGDSVWDMQAAGRAGVRAVGVLCGGYGRDELRAAGASEVYDDPEDLLDHLSEWAR